MAIANALMQGAIAMACLVASLFFYQFWRQTRDRFFLFFSGSFLIATLEHVLLGVDGVSPEREPLFYLLRLATHVLIIVAIIHKNREKPF
jgi:uncharacterized protein DUF5985